MTAEDVMQRYVAAARRGDFDTAFAMFAEDIVFRIPGRSSFSGEHRGREAAMAYINAARARPPSTRWRSRSSTRSRAPTASRSSWSSASTADGEIVEIRRANVYRVRGDEIDEIWIFEGDQYEVDALMDEA